MLGRRNYLPYGYGFFRFPNGGGAAGGIQKNSPAFTGLGLGVVELVGGFLAVVGGVVGGGLDCPDVLTGFREAGEGEFVVGVAFPHEQEGGLVEGLPLDLLVAVVGEFRFVVCGGFEDGIILDYTAFPPPGGDELECAVLEAFDAVDPRDCGAYGGVFLPVLAIFGAGGGPGGVAPAFLPLLIVEEVLTFAVDQLGVRDGGEVEKLLVTGFRVGCFVGFTSGVDDVLHLVEDGGELVAVLLGFDLHLGGGEFVRLLVRFRVLRGGQTSALILLDAVEVLLEERLVGGHCGFLSCACWRDCR